MTQARRGRPRKTGPRNAKGRLIAANDLGNQRVSERAAAFAAFRCTHAARQIGDQIGQAWVAGLLDGHARDSAILRDAGRRYAGLYWHQFADLAPKTRQLEKQDRGAANDGGDDRAGDYFTKLDQYARSAGADAVGALHALCVDSWWFPDTDAAWISRLIGGALRDAGSTSPISPPTMSDRAKLHAATQALLAMVEG